MGQIIKAVCACGLESDPIYQGSGFATGQTGRHLEPAYCPACGTVGGCDGSKPLHHCTACGGELRFFREALHYPPLEEPLFPEDYDYSGGDRQWTCPGCRQKGLRFIPLGLWD